MARRNKISILRSRPPISHSTASGAHTSEGTGWRTPPRDASQAYCLAEVLLLFLGSRTSARPLLLQRREQVNGPQLSPTATGLSLYAQAELRFRSQHRWHSPHLDDLSPTQSFGVLSALPRFLFRHISAGKPQSDPSFHPFPPRAKPPPSIALGTLSPSWDPSHSRRVSPKVAHPNSPSISPTH